MCVACVRLMLLEQKSQQGNVGMLVIAEFQAHTKVEQPNELPHTQIKSLRTPGHTCFSWAKRPVVIARDVF